MAAAMAKEEEKPAEVVVKSKSRRYAHGASELKGRRPTMEDASVIHGCFNGKDDCDLFCVFDGHGSRHSAAYCAQHLPDRLGKKLKDGVKPDTALRETFVQVAEELKPTTKGNGTTAAVALIVRKKLWVANVGDSRVVLCRGRSSAVEAREKEKKAKEEEKQRLEKEQKEKEEKERIEKEKKKKEKEEKERLEKEAKEKKKEEGVGGAGKRPMERKERNSPKSVCHDRGSSPSSPSRHPPSSSSTGPSSPLTKGHPSPSRTPSSSSSNTGPSSSPSSRKRPQTYSSPAPKSALPKLTKNGEEKKEEEKKEVYDSEEDSNPDSNVDPFGDCSSDEEASDRSSDTSNISDPFKSDSEADDPPPKEETPKEENKKEDNTKKDEDKGAGDSDEDSNPSSNISDPFASDGSNSDSDIADPFASDGSNDDSAIADPFASDGSNDDSAISDPFRTATDVSDNDNPDSDIIMSDCESEEEEEPIPDYLASRLSYDHRPDSVSEQERIKGLGGFIINGRVGGQLAVTRAIGDAQLYPFVSPEPYITETDLKDDDEFIVIACDGLFDVFPDDVVVTIARGEKDPEKASDRLSRQAYGAGSTDNISVVVVRLLKD